MSINEKDIKILWSKAAGRCSMFDCRKKLIAESGATSGNSLIGENCHIIGEKNSKNSPRGISSLDLKDRHRYPNLILLCRNHHKIIDDDEKNWPVELLHQIKSDHELWVETALSESIDEDDKWYSDLINFITESFYLMKWETICDNAIRNIVYSELVDGISDISECLFKAIFPGKRKGLEEKIINLEKHASKFSKHFLSNAYLDKNNRFRARKFYKEINPNPNYYEDLEKYQKWEKISTHLLFNFVLALNEFSDKVREEINPNYFKYQGRFVVLDSMGILGGSLVYTTYIPEEYFKTNTEF